jgi:hypothetical protein
MWFKVLVCRKPVLPGVTIFVELDLPVLQQNTASHSAPLKRSDCTEG